MNGKMREQLLEKFMEFLSMLPESGEESPPTNEMAPVDAEAPAEELPVG